MKADGTIITAADIASEEILLAAISMHAPRPHRLVSEERAPSLVADATPSTWFVDPLDGTRSYVIGSTDFAVLISEWAAGEARFSVVYYPALGELAVAAGHRAAWTPSNTPAATPAGAPRMGVVHACYIRSPALRRLATEAGAAYREEETESSRALLDVATGAASAAVVLLCGHKSWDLAPLLHLIIAAGAFVSDEAGYPVRMSGPDVSGRYIIAARNPSLHKRLMTASWNLPASEL